MIIDSKPIYLDRNQYNLFRINESRLGSVTPFHVVKDLVYTQITRGATMKDKATGRTRSLYVMSKDCVHSYTGLLTWFLLAIHSFLSYAVTKTC